MNAFLAELRRRNVFRVAAAYLVVGWLILQVIALIEAPLALPAWTDTLVIVLLGVGLPVALIFAWAFEMTPEGVKRTIDVDPETSISDKTGRRLDYAVFAALIVLVGLIGWQQVGGRPATLPETADARVAAALDRSIAVLPFEDFSPQGDQEWFADGLAEEILNALARAPDLLVASRTSSFAYKNSDEEIPAIAEALGVAHILEGSVRRSGDRLRVTAQLIRASDGFHLWSENYDRSTADAIAIQEDIAIEIARTLETALDPEALADMADVGTSSIAAYEAYLEGLALLRRQSNSGEEGLQDQAGLAFDRARSIDPDFVAAHAAAAQYYATAIYPTTTGSVDARLLSESLRGYLERIDGAIAASRDETQTALYRARRAHVLGRLNDAADYLYTYIEARPLDDEALAFLATVEVHRARYEAAREAGARSEALIQGQAANYRDQIISYVWARAFDDAARIAREGAAAHPDNFGLLYQAHRALLWAGDFETAARIAPRLINNPDVGEQTRLLVSLRQFCVEGRREEAEAAYERIRDFETADVGGLWLSAMVMGREEDAYAVAAPFDRETPPYPLLGWLFYPYFDATLFPHFNALLEREGVERPPPVDIPYACPPAEGDAP